MERPRILSKSIILVFVAFFLAALCACGDMDFEDADQGAAEQALGVRITSPAGDATIIEGQSIAFRDGRRGDIALHLPVDL